MQTLLLVSHTHWDREWYLTFEEYRTRLVATYDTLLDVLERVPDFHSFAFDGQTVPVDDYLEIRPEARDRIREQVRAKRLFVGPLYVLPDGYAPSGEAWVRNLTLGLERCADLGGSPGHAYIAEPTNLPEQFPQILGGFGFDAAVFGRGLSIDQRDGSDVRVRQSEYFWEGPGDSRLLVVHMPAYYDDEHGSRCILHYCNSAEVFWGPAYDPLRQQERTTWPSQPEGALARISILREFLTPLATSGTLLLMHGCDHLPPQPDTPEFIRAVNARLEGAQVVHGSLSDYLDAVRAAGIETSGDCVARRGESRSRGGALSRVFLRRLHADTTTLLERWMEPAAAMSRSLGGPGDPGLMRQAWRYLLQNQAHDTIWGCSIDAVYDEVRVRFAKSTQIAAEVAGEALEHVAGQIGTKALNTAPGGRPYVAFSTSGWEHGDVAEAEVWLPADMKGNALSVVDGAGRSWPAQVIQAHTAKRRTDRFRRTAHVEPVTAVRALVRTEDLPAVGYSTVRVAAADDPVPSDLAVGPTWIENDSLRVDVHPDGSFRLTDLRTGRATDGLNGLIDQGDGGHGWSFNRIEHDRIIRASDHPGDIRVVESGPVRATLEVRVRWKLPEGLTADGTRRLRRARACPLTVRISLVARIPRVEVRTTLDNRARNHRLRALFPTGLQTDAVQADGAFAIHERPIHLPPTAPRERRTGIGYYPSMPEETGMMHSFVDVSDGRDGLALLTTGVPQYEVQRAEDSSTVLALTLMRAAVGHTQLHDADLTHGGQCLGEQAAEYALLPHVGDWRAGDVHREAQRYLSPPRLVPTTWHDGVLDLTGAWMDPLPPEIALTALKPSQDGRDTVLRLVNLAREERSATVRFSQTPSAVARCNLREEPLTQLDLSPDGSVRASFAAMEIVTLRVSWQARA